MSLALNCCLLANKNSYHHAFPKDFRNGPHQAYVLLSIVTTVNGPAYPYVHSLLDIESYIRRTMIPSTLPFQLDTHKRSSADFRSDWDPTKWIIWVLHEYTPFVPTISRTPDSSIRSAQARVLTGQANRIMSSLPKEHKVRPKEELPVWSRAEIRKRHGEWVMDEITGQRRRRVLLLSEGCVVDAGGFLEEHVGYFLFQHRIF